MNSVNQINCTFNRSRIVLVLVYIDDLYEKKGETFSPNWGSNTHDFYITCAHTQSNNAEKKKEATVKRICISLTVYIKNSMFII